MDDLSKVIEIIYDNFKEKASKEQIKSILDFKEEYIKDKVDSIGKSLRIKRVRIEGVKDIAGKKCPIQYDREIYDGVNVWIADNFKGKSTILKCIKYALTGDNDLKADVKKWINGIYVEFQIGEIIYTNFIESGQRCKGKVLKLDINEFLKHKKIDEILVLFSFNNKDELKLKLEELFYSNFHYYDLKWTSKDSSKESINIRECSTSWSTYFKSICLESKDYGNLFMDKGYGGQEQKILEMLLGLKYTYLINRLNHKMEILQYKKAQHQNYNDILSDNKNNADIWKSQLEKVESEIKICMKKQNEKYYIEGMLKNRDEIIRMTLLNSDQFEQFKQQYDKLEKEILKANRYLNNIDEYIEFGSYLSGLKIDTCPSCNHEIDKKEIVTAKEEKTCPLCSEKLVDHKDVNIYIQKKTEQEELIKQLDAELIKLKQELDLKENESERLAAELKVIQVTIESKSSTNEYLNTQNELFRLIEESGRLKGLISNLESNNLNITNNGITIDTEIEILQEATTILRKMRASESQGIFDKLNALILENLNHFGITNISKITLDYKMNLRFVQNECSNKFEDLSEGEKLRAKIAVLLSIIRLDIDYKIGRHPRFIIIDSTGKEEVVQKDLKGLSDVFKDIDRKYGEKIQILVGTALREFRNATVEYEKIECKDEGEEIF